MTEQELEESLAIAKTEVLLDIQSILDTSADPLLDAGVFIKRELARQMELLGPIAGKLSPEDEAFARGELEKMRAQAEELKRKAGL